jgi:AcrR family transcriptional regulator
MNDPRRREASERDRIVAGVTRLVGENGYSATSLGEVLSEAEVDEEAFHRHFDDLRAAFLSAWSSASERYMQRALGAFQRETEWRLQIRAVACSIFEFLIQDPHQGWILFVEGCNPDEPVRSPVDDPNVEAFVMLIDAGRYQMEDPTVLTKATAEGIFGAVKERIVAVLLERDHDRLPSLFAPLMAMVVRPYLGDEVALEELRLGAPDV